MPLGLVLWAMTTSSHQGRGKELECVSIWRQTQEASCSKERTVGQDYSLQSPGDDSSPKKGDIISPRPYAERTCGHGHI